MKKDCDVNADRNNPSGANRLPLRRRKSKAGRNVAIGAVCVLLAVGSAWSVWAPREAGGWARGIWAEDTEFDPSKWHEVKRGPLTISLRRTGVIHHRDKVIVRSKLEGVSTVIWLIDEGEYVEAGELLLEMDPTAFEQTKESQDIVVVRMEAWLVNAEGVLAFVKNAGQTAIEDATLAIKLAELDLKKYVGARVYDLMLARIEAESIAADRGAALAAPREATLMKWMGQAIAPPRPVTVLPAIDLAMEHDVTGRVLDYAKALVRIEELSEAIEEDPEEGDGNGPDKAARTDPGKEDQGEYPQLRRDAKGAITIAEEELKIAEERVKWSAELEKDGYLTDTELQADKLAAKRAQLNLKSARSKLAVLKEYTYAHRLAELQNALLNAQRALKPVERKAAADIKQAEANLVANQSEYKRQLALQAKYAVRIKECKVYAPVAGQVVYATTTSQRWREQSEQLRKGSSVYERKELFHMPNADRMMMAVIQVPQACEPLLTDPKDGSLLKLPARVTIAGAKDRSFPATVAKIDPLPYHEWIQSIKVFNTEIHLDDVCPDLRPGYTCKVYVIIDRYDDVLSVPLQSVQLVRGKPTVYVRTPTGPEPRVVEVGMDNNRLVHIKSGLDAGEYVLLAPPFDETEVDPSGQVPDKNKRQRATTRPAAKRKESAKGADKGKVAGGGQSKR